MEDSRVFVAPVCGDVGLWSGFDEISKIAPSPTSSAGLFPKKNEGGGEGRLTHFLREKPWGRGCGQSSCNDLWGFQDGGHCSCKDFWV